MVKKDKEHEAVLEDQWHFQMPTGVFVVYRSRRLLKRFEALTKHYFHYATDMHPEAKLEPLNKLIRNYNQALQYEQLNEAINKLVPLVYQNLDYMHAPTDFVYTETKEKFNIILDFFRIDDGLRQERYELVIETLQRSIGVYDSIIGRFWRWRWWQPTYLVATIINLPLRVLSISGLNVENEKTSNLYFWVVKSLLIILLALVIIRQGIALDIVQVISKLVI